MNDLKQFYNKLNQSNYDGHSTNEINYELQKISKKLNEKKDFITFKLSELERQAFAITKSFDKTDDSDSGTLNGLSWQMSGIKTSEDGSTEPFYWPDVRRLKDEDFQYFEERYKSCENLYAKTQFGLLVYFGNRTAYSKHIDFKKSLFKELFDLSQIYLNKAENQEDKNHYIPEYFTNFKNAFLLANKSKLKEELDKIINSLSDTHHEWKIKMDATLLVLIDLSRLTSEYFTVFKNKINYDKIIFKNNEGAEEFKKDNIWGAIYLMDINIDIAKKTNKPFESFLEHKANLYLKLSDDAEKDSNMAAVTFTESALRLYQQLKNNGKVIEIEKKYSEQRGKFQLMTI